VVSGAAPRIGMHVRKWIGVELRKHRRRRIQIPYGIEIEQYFAFTIDAITIVNDLVGRVTVTVEDDFSNVDPTLIQGTTVALTDNYMEHFIRKRMNISDEPAYINRMNRQQVYLTGPAKGMGKAYAGDPGYVVDAYSASAGSMVSDCTVEELSDYGEFFSG